MFESSPEEAPSLISVAPCARGALETSSADAFEAIRVGGISHVEIVLFVILSLCSEVVETCGEGWCSEVWVW